MPDLTTEQLTYALAAVAAVALVALLVAVVLWVRLRKLRRQYAIVRGGGEDRDFLQTLSGWAKQVEAISKRVDGVVADQQRHAAVARLALQRFHLVRYDAFEDMGGRLSFSAALLDDHGDGLVITSINGRTETRTYAKPIRSLASDHNLSDEEREAIAGASPQSPRRDRRAPVSS
ncbi:MAG TPA: DUF4446 family protein [Actinomycetota bacterium]|nr:DUF4446 family protein [Actinomycetota bacterium]